MKYFLILLAATIVAIEMNAQTDLKFDKRFVECEDKWVAFQMSDDSTHTYGFIYIDEAAGLTLNYEGIFKISTDGKFIPKKLDDTGIKYRLEANQVRVAFIPENRFEELQISAIPDWLKHYKSDTLSIQRLYKWGFSYNGWGECAKALTFLEKAQQIDSNYNGLGVELAYSYNCLGQYENAVLVLENALKLNPTDAYTNKELIFSQVKLGQLDKASESCKNAILICTDKTYNWENCYNILYQYYIKKDKINFKYWLTEIKKWLSGNENVIDSIKLMENELIGIVIND